MPLIAIIMGPHVGVSSGKMYPSPEKYIHHFFKSLKKKTLNHLQVQPTRLTLRLSLSIRLSLRERTIAIVIEIAIAVVFEIKSLRGGLLFPLLSEWQAVDIRRTLSERLPYRVRYILDDAVVWWAHWDNVVYYEQPRGSTMMPIHTCSGTLRRHAFHGATLKSTPHTLQSLLLADSPGLNSEKFKRPYFFFNNTLLVIFGDVFLYLLHIN